MSTEAETTRKLVVIEDGLLSNLAANANFTAAFPFLAAINGRAAQQRQGGCGGCGAAGRARAAVFAQARAAIATMDNESKRRFKEMLGATHIRVRYYQGGRAVERTF